jgi:hypothetical protein
MDEENNQIAHFTWYQEAKRTDSGGIKNSPPTGTQDNWRTVRMSDGIRNCVPNVRALESGTEF